MKTNKEKILCKIAKIQSLIIIDDYINTVTLIDSLLCEIRYMTEIKPSTFPENERKGGISNEK